MAEPLLVHNVYFALNDNSTAGRDRLLASCRKYLTKHDGTVFFAVGTRAADLCRPVNDLDFDVGLHIIFQNQATHDAYQISERHKKFIEENKSNWKKVRVFDSLAEKT